MDFQLILPGDGRGNWDDQLETIRVFYTYMLKTEAEEISPLGVLSSADISVLIIATPGAPQTCATRWRD